MLPAPYWIVVAVTIAAVVTCVILHYEALRMISDLLPTPKRHHRRRVVFLILCLMLVHCVEIWIFGIANFSLLRLEGFGELVGLNESSLLNCIYYSTVVFSTLGFGDIIPQGPIRFLTGMEAIAGLTFITWSASFTIVDMMNTWNDANTQGE
jgi:hypothetical protein